MGCYTTIRPLRLRWGQWTFHQDLDETQYWIQQGYAGVSLLFIRYICERKGSQYFAGTSDICLSQNKKDEGGD